MTIEKTATSADSTKKAGKDVEKTREERLAEALRANLRRRKAAAKKEEAR